MSRMTLVGFFLAMVIVGNAYAAKDYFVITEVTYTEVNYEDEVAAFYKIRVKKIPGEKRDFTIMELDEMRDLLNLFNMNRTKQLKGKRFKCPESNNTLYFDDVLQWHILQKKTNAAYKAPSVEAVEERMFAALIRMEQPDFSDVWDMDMERIATQLYANVSDRDIEYLNSHILIPSNYRVAANMASPEEKARCNMGVKGPAAYFILRDQETGEEKCLFIGPYSSFVKVKDLPN